MRFASLLLAAGALAFPTKRDTPIAPKVFIVSLFELERDPWLESSPLSFTQNITVPGLSPIYDTIHCTESGDVCQVTLGEGEINAAASLTALTLSPKFDLKKTYFLSAGIAGGEPQYTTIGSATFAKYAVQVGLEYQIAYQDYINTNPNWTTGYFPYGTDSPYAYPGNVYGTEVFELNEKLRDRALGLAQKADLDNGTEGNAAFRELYDFPAAKGLPKAVACDSLTSDNYFTGNVYGDYFSQLASVLTNGSAVYCATAQEDNASLEVLVRMHKAGLVDYERVVIMRTISDFSRPPPSLANNTVEFFTNTSFGGISASLTNLVSAGYPFVKDVLENWSEYENGVNADNYYGDIYGTLGGKMDFGKDDFEVA